MLESRGIRKNQVLAWPDDYYWETDAKKREEMLKGRLIVEDSEENRIRSRLFEKRYVTPGKGIQGTDYFMKIIMTMEKIAESKDSFFGKKSFQKGIREIRDTFCLDLLQDKPEYSELWKEEFVNLWSLYIEVCRDDNNYAGLLLGTGRMSKGRLIEKLEADIYHKSTELPEQLGLAREMAPFREAASEAFYRYYS